MTFPFSDVPDPGTPLGLTAKLVFESTTPYHRDVCAASSTTDLDLTTLASACSPPLSYVKVQSYIEAAEVALARHHSPPTKAAIHLDESSTEPALIHWVLPGGEQLASYADPEEATEDGACAVAYACVMADGMRVVSRLPKHTGGDFHLVMPSGAVDDEQFLRLEVSGIGAGCRVSDHRRRLREKIDQLRRGEDGPGIAIVVAFEPPCLYWESVE